MRKLDRWIIRARIGIQKAAELLQNEDGIGTVEMILILVGIFTPYYGVGIRCMA